MNERIEEGREEEEEEGRKKGGDRMGEEGRSERWKEEGRD